MSAKNEDNVYALEFQSASFLSKEIQIRKVLLLMRRSEAFFSSSSPPSRSAHPLHPSPVVTTGVTEAVALLGLGVACFVRVF